MEDFLKRRRTIFKLKLKNKRLNLERLVLVAVRCFVGASRRTLERALSMLEHPNETKINELYKSQPAMRHHVVIQDLKVRHVCMNLLQW